jgi:methyl-accepting chemotaxis protein
MKGENKMAEVEYAGVKVGGSKLLLIIPMLGTMVGGLWGGFELYNRLIDAEKKISALQPQAILSEVARMESVFDFIKEDLEKQIQDIQDDVDDAEDLAEETEDLAKEIEDDAADAQKELRDAVYEMEKEMQSRFKEMDTDIRDMRSDLEDRIQQILENPLNDVE